MKRVLVAEDEKPIREFVVLNLKRNGFEVLEAEDGEAAIRLYDEYGGDIDVALLDIMMPGLDGIEVCKRIRKKNSTIGIVMLTAKTQEMDKVTGLLVGADDYVTKPFSVSELMARVDAIYRRVSLNKDTEVKNKNKANIITLGIFTLDIKSRTLSKAGQIIELTQVEFQIVEFFFNNPNTAIERSTLLEAVWGTNYFGDEKVVDVNIRRLRVKLEDDPARPEHLTKVWGIGYKWVV